MTRKRIITGLDIGSMTTRVVIAEHAHDEAVRVIGVGQVPSAGVRRGAIVESAEAADAIDQAIAKAEEMAGVQVQNLFVGIGGVGIATERSKGVVAVGRDNGEVSDDDVERVIAAAQAISVPLNAEIVHVIPRAFNLDDQEGISDPVGMKGVRLEVDAMVIEVPLMHMKNLTQALEHASVNVDDMIIGPLAAATAVLDKQQKELGIAMLSIGAGTTSLVVFEEGDIVHTAVLPVGAGHITNDIAIGLRTTISVAEEVKLQFGSASRQGIDKTAEIDLSAIDSQEEGSVSHHHVLEIIDARLAEIFQLAHQELKSIEKDHLLPGGVVLTGGGAELPMIVDYAKKALGLPAQIGYPQKELAGLVDKVDTPAFSTVVGLVLWAADDDEGGTPLRFGGGKSLGNLSGTVDHTVHKMKGWFEKFLP